MTTCPHWTSFPVCPCCAAGVNSVGDPCRLAPRYTGGCAFSCSMRTCYLGFYKRAPFSIVNWLYQSVNQPSRTEFLSYYATVLYTTSISCYSPFQAEEKYKNGRKTNIEFNLQYNRLYPLAGGGGWLGFRRDTNQWTIFRVYRSHPPTFINIGGMQVRENPGKMPDMHKSCNSHVILYTWVMLVGLQ